MQRQQVPSPKRWTIVRVVKSLNSTHEKRDERTSREMIEKMLLLFAAATPVSSNST
jgi:hypothetical protein